MSTEVHHFKVGAFECIAVSDGTLTYAPPTFPPPAAFLSTRQESALSRPSVDTTYSQNTGQSG